MSDDGKPMTDEERRAFLEKWNQENLASMTPFERYLFDSRLFDDVIRPEITAEDVILEPDDLASISAASTVSAIVSTMDGFLIAPTSATRTSKCPTCPITIAATWAA